MLMYTPTNPSVAYVIQKERDAEFLSHARCTAATSVTDATNIKSTSLSGELADKASRTVPLIATVLNKSATENCMASRDRRGESVNRLIHI